MTGVTGYYRTTTFRQGQNSMLTGDMLRRSAQRFPDKAAIVCGDVQLNYQQLDAQANQLANALLGLDLPKGTTIGIVSRNLPEYGVAFFGVARSGLILTNVSVLYAAEELQYVLTKARVKVLIFDAVFEENVAQVAPLLPNCDTLIRIEGANRGSTGNSNGSIDCESFTRFVANQPTDEPSVTLSEDDPFCMTYTGGTTGRPKGVLCSHRARAVTAHTVMVEEALDERDVIGIVTPMFHVAALNIMFQPAILAGATTTFLSKWSPAGFTQMVQQTCMTACFMVPTQAAGLLQDPAFDPNRFVSWTKFSFAGAPMPDWVQKSMREHLPAVVLTQIYGQSEMGVIAVLRDWYLPEKLGSVGRQPYNVDVRVVDAQGNDVAPGEIGEVVSRGENLMLEYYDEPEQTREFYKLGDGWGWSGDLATIDAQGFITLVDRSKDMFISGGENIYPKEIENAIYEIDGVAECAVFGIPDDRWGEVPAVHISLKPGAQIDEQQVIDYCALRLARFKRPRLVRFVDDFPKTAIGKIQKTVLREPYWQVKDD